MSSKNLEAFLPGYLALYDFQRCALELESDLQDFKSWLSGCVTALSRRLDGDSGSSDERDTMLRSVSSALHPA